MEEKDAAEAAAEAPASQNLPTLTVTSSPSAAVKGKKTNKANVLPKATTRKGKKVCQSPPAVHILSSAKKHSFNLLLSFQQSQKHISDNVEETGTPQKKKKVYCNIVELH